MKILLVIISLCFVVPLNGQDHIVDFAEITPKFPGGEKAKINYVQNHIFYPKVAVENKEQGVAYVQFVVFKDGHIGQARIIRSVSPSLDKEAIRVVTSMPNWTPGSQKGKVVNVRCVLPVRFILKNNSLNTHKPKERERRDSSSHLLHNK